MPHAGIGLFSPLIIYSSPLFPLPQTFLKIYFADNQLLTQGLWTLWTLIVFIYLFPLLHQHKRLQAVLKF